MTKQELQVLRSRLGDLYNDYRKELASKKYYAVRLTYFRRLNTWMEIIGALGTGSMASLAVFRTVPGRYVWLLVSGAAAVIVPAKPVLKLGKKIEDYASLLAGHSDAHWELESIVRKVKELKSLPDELEKRHEATLIAVKNLEKNLEHSAEPIRKKAIMKRSEDEANEEILRDPFWLPATPPARLQPPAKKQRGHPLKPSVPLQAA